MVDFSSKVLLKVGYACNNNCVFCHSAPHRGLDLSTAELLQRVGWAARAGADMLVLSGGEPTIRPDLPALASAVAAAGMRLGLVSNGRMLVYRELTDHLLACGLDYVYLSLCGPNRRLNDAQARATAFDQLIRSARYLSDKIEDLTFNVVITRQNLDQLQQMAGLVAGLGAASVRLKFSCLEPEGKALERFDALVPELARAAAAAVDAVARARRDHPGLRLALDGFPLCLLPGCEELDAGLRADGFFAMGEAFEDRLHPVDDDNRSFGRACAGCSLKRRCRGVYSTYLQRRGEAELAPVLRPVPNSFDLVADPRAAAAEESLDLRSCPIRAGRRPPPDPIRGLLLRSGPGRARRLWADGRDFSDRTLRATLRQREQVYLDRGGCPALDDFPAQLERLELAAACRRCRRRPVCGGLFRRSRGSGFEREIQRLAAWLAGLRGSVLDVGCGSGPYLDALRPALAAGRLHYLGVDPQATPGQREPGVRLERSAFEDFRWDGPPFSTVIALRSLNHLPDPAAALARMAALLEPGGRLLLVEDVVFATIRPAELLARVRARDDLPFEHLHNLEPEDLEAAAAAAGLAAVSRRTPDRSGCTLWSLVFEKRG
jgi:MoaA/NifB/PqqE/SkfB family radical SAM enzyme/SAM-dependent methyltransferase